MHVRAMRRCIQSYLSVAEREHGVPQCRGGGDSCYATIQRQPTFCWLPGRQHKRGGRLPGRQRLNCRLRLRRRRGRGGRRGRRGRRGRGRRRRLLHVGGWHSRPRAPLKAAPEVCRRRRRALRRDASRLSLLGVGEAHTHPARAKLQRLQRLSQGQRDGRSGRRARADVHAGGRGVALDNLAAEGAGNTSRSHHQRSLPQVDHARRARAMAAVEATRPESEGQHTLPLALRLSRTRARRRQWQNGSRQSR